MKRRHTYTTPRRLLYSQCPKPAPLRNEISSVVGRFFDPLKRDAAKNHGSFGSFRDQTPFPVSRSKSVKVSHTQNNFVRLTTDNPPGTNRLKMPVNSLNIGYSRLKPPLQKKCFAFQSASFYTLLVPHIACIPGQSFVCLLTVFDYDD